MPPPVIGEAENPAVDVDQQATVNELQNQMTAMQAAFEGNSQASLFKPRSFNGFPNEDVNEWLSKFDRFAKFYNWSNAKRLGAIALLLEGSALAWYHTLGEETTGNLTNLIDALKDRFGAQNLEFIFRQELYARKQGLTEPLSLYTEDIIKKCQRLSLSDKDMMNIFINGLSEDLKTHVVLNQPKAFAEAENLARLRDSVTKSYRAAQGSIICRRRCYVPQFSAATSRARRRAQFPPQTLECVVVNATAGSRFRCRNFATPRLLEFVVVIWTRRDF